ncbi:glycosyl hydrolase [Acidobacteriota bacterium]
MKKSWKFLALVLIILAAVTGCQEKMVQDSYNEVLEAFQDPPSEYRSVPFWVWNDRITEKQIDEQLEDFKTKGIGGVFIHPRPGLITPYLSEEWLSLCRYTVDKAKDLGMKVWLYDENSYPSGFAGGHVPDQMPDSKRSSLRMEKIQYIPHEFEYEPFLVFQKTMAGFEDVTSNIKNMVLQAGEFYVFDFAEQNPSPWYGGFTYVDLMRREVTEKFLEITLEPYKKIFGDEFGKTVPGIFQDEAHIGAAVGGALSFTPALFETFEKKWGYDLKANLPSLLEETGFWRSVRHNYYSVLNDLFLEGWAKPYFEYCEANGLKFTGHYWEHEWPRPRLVPDNMAMYAYSHMPGVDILMNDWDMGPNSQFGNARAIKEIRSVANQIGFERTMSETFGAGGWEMSFFDQKRIADWQYALGVNFLNQHLSYVTIKGSRKRDHPLSFSYHEPWWDNYTILGDYFGRMSVVTSMGIQENKILVLEPTTSAWLYFSPTNRSPQVETIGKAFQNFVNRLESHQVEYDLGSESIIQNFGSAEEGRFVVGERAYDLVVLPPGTENLESGTADLIKSYLLQGGKVLSWVDPPILINGFESTEIADLAVLHKDNWIFAEGVEGWDLMVSPGSASLVFQQPEEIGGHLFHHRRVLKDAELVLLVNSSPSEVSAGRFLVNGGSCEHWDPFTGAVEPYPFQQEGESVSVEFKVPPGGSLLLCIKNDNAESPLKPEVTYQFVQPETELKIHAEFPNVLTLDYCDLTLGDLREEDLYFYDAQRKTFQHHGLSGNPWDRAVQFKTNILDLDDFSADSGFSADFQFEVAEGTDMGSLNVVVERAGLYTVSFNGEEIQPEEGIWWLDKDFRVFDIGDLAMSGSNRLTLKAQPFSIHTELEAVYVLGNFALESKDKGFVLHPARKLGMGSWKEQGMPFYSSGIKYEREFLIPEFDTDSESFFVSLGDWKGTVAEVFVNGESVGCIGFQPYTLDVTGAIREGANMVSVVVYGTLKNTLGPFHNNPPLGRAWPASFQRGAESGYPPGNDYHVLDYGLFEDFQLVWGRTAITN